MNSNGASDKVPEETAETGVPELMAEASTSTLLPPLPPGKLLQIFFALTYCYTKSPN